MSEPILVLGQSGSGKSTSMRNMDPSKTLIISVDGKSLPFRAKDWPVLDIDNKEGSLYFPKKGALYSGVRKAIKFGIESGKKSFVIDDSQFLMAHSFFDRAMETGYNKFSELGCDFWNLITLAKEMPDDCLVYLLHHEEKEDDGTIVAKTLGKMLKDKGDIAGRFTICLLARREDGKGKFYSEMEGQQVAKAPMEMFKEPVMDNDLAVVDATIREFYGIEN